MADYYISQFGDDALGNGTEGNPWASVQKALNSLVGGVAGGPHTIYLQGTITPPGKANFTTCGFPSSESQRLTFAGHPDGTGRLVINYSSGGHNTGGWLTGTFATLRFITYYDFEVRLAGQTVWLHQGDRTHLSKMRCDFTNTVSANNSPITLESGTQYITDCFIIGGSYRLIFASSAIVANSVLINRQSFAYNDLNLKNVAELTNCLIVVSGDVYGWTAARAFNNTIISETPNIVATRPILAATVAIGNVIWAPGCRAIQSNSAGIVSRNIVNGSIVGGLQFDNGVLAASPFVNSGANNLSGTQQINYEVKSYTGYVNNKIQLGAAVAELSSSSGIPIGRLISGGV